MFRVEAVSSWNTRVHSALRRATEQAKLRRTTATDLWLGDNAARTTAVTGSKGKSTTAALVRAISVAHGVGCELGGNIGIPLLGLPEAERYAAELSSYQCSSVTTSPDVVVLTALFPEHLDWHGSEEQYYADDRTKHCFPNHQPWKPWNKGWPEGQRSYLIQGKQVNIYAYHARQVRTLVFWPALLLRNMQSLKRRNVERSIAALVKCFGLWRVGNMA